MLETALAYYCGPALAGIKTANLVSCFRRDYPRLNEELEDLNQKLNNKDIYFTILCACSERTLIMVYRKQKLWSHLQNRDTVLLLKEFGYPMDSFEKMLECLRQRVTSNKEFPHEIGVFLGYPLHDVKGFIEKKEAKYTGHWKVYKQVEEAKKLFHRYDLCRTAILRQMDRGKDLNALFGSG